MNRLILLLLLLTAHAACTSVNTPGPDSWPDPSGENEPPALVSPKNGADSVSPSLTLQWEEVDGASSYNVQVATDQNFTSLITDKNPDSTRYEITGLETGATYYWRVRTQSEWSEVWSFTTTPETTPPPSNGSSSDIWVSAYLASWNHYAPPGGNWGNLPTQQIDWEAFTHLIYFAMGAQTNGSLSEIEAYHNMNSDRINAIVSAAHRHDKPVIISVGGWGNYEGFSQAITPAVRPVYVQNLVALLKTWGFDGIDLDMEPIRDKDKDNYRAFVQDLHAALQTLTTPLGIKPLLTAATSHQPELFSDLQQYFDQINLMTYDFSGAWKGWVSWHNSPVYNGGLRFPYVDKPLPSIHGRLQKFVDAGISRKKLGIGIDFYGYIWHGQVTGPGQEWAAPPRVEDNVPYHSIMSNYYSEDIYRWDEQAGAAWLSIDSSDPSQKKFISYDDEKSIQTKIGYVRDQDIGGVIIWELSGGYRKNQPAGSRDPLLQAVKNAVWE